MFHILSKVMLELPQARFLRVMPLSVPNQPISTMSFATLEGRMPGKVMLITMNSRGSAGW